MFIPARNRTPDMHKILEDNLVESSELTAFDRPVKMVTKYFCRLGSKPQSISGGLFPTALLENDVGATVHAGTNKRAGNGACKRGASRLEPEKMQRR